MGGGQTVHRTFGHAKRLLVLNRGFGAKFSEFVPFVRCKCVIVAPYSRRGEVMPLTQLHRVG